MDCHDGFFGEVCERNCSEHCTTPECNINNGSCECKVGYAGNPCTECPSNCDETGCNDDFHCYMCKDEYYGNFCNQTCSMHCVERICHRDGSCNCTVGYAGNPCAECPPNCDHTGCNDDFHCHTCDPGFYGDFCNQTCSEHCTANVCDKQDGSCKCKIGYAGNPCTECPPNCDDTGCNETFHCQTCYPGSFGSFCNQTCSEHCVDNRCHRDGRCTCNVGYGGHQCEPCPTNCGKTGCDEQLICHECDPGFYGDRCNSTCSTKCIYGTCNRDGSCNCSVGYGGHPCEACPSSCDSTGCDEQLICHKCYPGFFGDYCYLPCSANCVNGTCNRNGSCTCKKGFNGFGCCPENCKRECTCK